VKMLTLLTPSRPRMDKILLKLYFFCLMKCKSSLNLADQTAKCFETLFRIILVLFYPFSDNFQCHIKLFSAWLPIWEEAILWKSVRMTLFKRLVGFIEHFCIHSSIKIGHRSLKIAILNV
jgi:hypothetical protein